MAFPLIPLIAAAAGFGGAKLTNKKEGNGGINIAADPYAETRKTYLDWLNPQIGQPGKAYEGNLIAPLSPQENQSFDFLRQYGEAGPSQTMQQGKAEIGKTLTGQYDPATSPYYQAVKAEAAKNLAETQKSISGKAAGGGRYWTGARLEQQQEAASENARGLNTLMGSLAENERQNRLNVLPQAFQYGQAEQQLPLQKATAFQTLGGLPRAIEQMVNQANYQEWLRSQVDYPMQIGGMAMGTQQPPVYQQKPPSAIDQLMSGVGSGMGQLAPLLLMGLL